MSEEEQMQQKQDDEEHQRHALEALSRIAEVTDGETVMFFACELGVAGLWSQRNREQQ